MLKNIFVLAAAAAFALPGALRAEEKAEAPAPEIPAPAPMTTSEKSQALQALGWLIATQTQMDQLGFSESEFDDFSKGFRAFLLGKDNPVADMQKATEKLDSFFRARTVETRLKWDAKNRKFLEEIDKQPGVQKSESGLRYKIIEKGGDVVPNLKNTVVAKYKGTLIDGRVFDSTEKQGGAPAEFPLTMPDGTPAVIEGWREGLQKIGKGGKIMLYIPHELAYGTQGVQRAGILPMSALVFEVEIVDVKETPPAPAPELETETPETPKTPAAPEAATPAPEVQEKK